MENLSSILAGYENPNEELGGVVIIEKGDYNCRACQRILAIYRTFNR